MRLTAMAGATVLLLSLGGLRAQAPLDPGLPSVFLVGDARGWGNALAAWFDPSRANIVIRDSAATSHALVSEGAWDALDEELKTGDYVLLRFNPLPGASDESDLRKMIHDTKSKGGMPIVLSPGSLGAGSAGQSGERNREVAQSEGVAFIDSSAATDAEQNARRVVAGLKALRENAIIRTLAPAAQAIETAPPTAVLMAHLPLPKSRTAEFFRWLNLPLPERPGKPTLFLIGDSTVRNGRGDGVDGQWGWGDPLAVYFDPALINVVNRAVGGTGSRTFLNIGYWERVMAMLKPGDFVIMQFGHNDNGRGGPLAGVGDETEERDVPGGNRKETVHSYGWYLRQYISDARARGAFPMVCTLVPRNIWENGRIARPSNSHADWARAVAKREGVPLLDLNELIARRYDELGETAVTALFADKRVHTTRTGAEMSAAIVMSVLRGLPDHPLARYLRNTPATVW